MLLAALQMNELGQRCSEFVIRNALLLLPLQISEGLDFLDEMQARKLELSSFTFNPFIREFGRWTMIDEVGCTHVGNSRNYHIFGSLC